MSLELQHLVKGYPAVKSGEPVQVIRGLDLELPQGETAAIVGQSGSGKSTLLSLIAGLDQPDQGKVVLNGQDLGQLGERQLSTYRAQNLGIVFQQFHLLPHLSALENVTLPLELLGKPRAKEEAKQLLDAVGLGDRLHHFPATLSGGECQRVAIARALVVKPKLLLADEPTGNLDEHTGALLSEMFFQLVKEHQSTLLLVTHNRSLADQCGKCYTLKEGVLHVDVV